MSSKNYLGKQIIKELIIIFHLLMADSYSGVLQECYRKVERVWEATYWEALLLQFSGMFPDGLTVCKYRLFLVLQNWSTATVGKISLHVN